MKWLAFCANAYHSTPLLKSRLHSYYTVQDKKKPATLVESQSQRNRSPHSCCQCYALHQTR